MLKIRLAIQILGLNIAYPFGETTINQYKIAGKVLILANFDQVSDLDLLPPFLHKLVYPFALVSYTDFTLAIILLIVLPMPLHIFIDVFGH